MARLESAERVRKLGAKTIHSIGEIAKLQTIKDNNKDFVPPGDMLVELMNDNKQVIKRMRAAHEIADKHDDVATASILENFIDAAEKRNWFCSRPAAPAPTAATSRQAPNEKARSYDGHG